MSSLTKFLYVERERAKVSSTGSKKTPMILHFPIPVEFEEVCISLLSGDYHFVSVKENRQTRTGFFNLDLDDEDLAQARLLSFLYDHGQVKGWGGLSDVDGIPPEGLVNQVNQYFDSYGLNHQHSFTGLVGFAALLAGGFLEPPEKAEVPPPEDISVATLNGWMDDFFHVGKVDGRPVYFNEHIGPLIAFTAPPKDIGVLTRVGEHASIMVHNAERSLVLLKMSLQDVSGNDPKELPEGD